MRVRSLPIWLILAACSYKNEGHTPVVGGAQNERDNSAAPAYLCNAQGDPTGWLVDVLGDKFAPLPTGSLVHTAGVTMPTVSFAGPENYTLPAPDRHFIDKTRMPLAMRTRTSETDPHALTPGHYTITVTNLNGASGTSPAAALPVIPPPSETQVQAQPPGGSHGAAHGCNDQSPSLTITGPCPPAPA